MKQNGSAHKSRLKENEQPLKTSTGNLGSGTEESMSDIDDMEIVLDQVHQAQSQGDFEVAEQILENKIREGGWKKAKLWWELVALMKTPADYQRIRRLWLDSPKSCRKRLSLLRAVARAACVAGEYEEAKVILRMAILFAAKKRRKQKKFFSGNKQRLQNILPASSDKKKEEYDSFINRAPQALRDLNELLEEFEVKSFLISGTLLGFLRDGGIISWDKDIDVGVFAEEVPHNLEELFRGEENFSVRRIDFNSDRLRITHSNKVAIDIFPHYREGEVLWHDGTATRWWNTPFNLKKTNFLGAEQWIPDNPELYLEENYGPWEVPDPYFDPRIDAPNVEVTDKEYFDALLYFSLLNSIVKNKQHMEKRYISLLYDLGETEWLQRL